jgi:lysozyme
MEISAIGRALIERNEGLRLTAYPDPATGGDPWTIGYGDTGPDVVEGLTITKEEADQRLSNRLAREFEPAINREIGGKPTTQGEFDAMVSLEYNIGVGGFAHSSVLHDHILGNYSGAAAAFLMWDRAAGRVLAPLLRRRKEEAALYLGGAEIPADAMPTARDHIMAAQHGLNVWGIDPPIAEDGLFGAETRDAIRVFQGDAKLPVTGLPDDQTLAALTALAK